MALSRRDVLRRSLLASAAAVSPLWSFTGSAPAQEVVKSPNERLRVGVIGNGGIAGSHGGKIPTFGDIVALCDVDENQSGRYNEKFARDKADVYGDHRKLLDRKDVDVVFICTPDHWHVKIALDAARAGKDIYCEKPLTLTIDEGRILSKVIAETGRVLQVGTQQRSDSRFQTAVSLARDGRMGKLQRIHVAIGGGSRGKPFPVVDVPAGFDFDRWLGQAPLVEFRRERTHGSFRWWYEYSGGKMTDWGAHHVDIAQWALGDEAHPLKFEVLQAEHPVVFSNGWPQQADTFNTATAFNVKATFAGGIEMFIRDRCEDLGFDNGVMFEAENGRWFVNRGKLTGEPIEELKSKPLPAAAYDTLRKGRGMMNHHENFVQSVRDRGATLSDIASHHRHLTTCHLANIALRMNRTVAWDALAQQITGDAQANAFQQREQRKGYEVV